MDDTDKTSDRSCPECGRFFFHKNSCPHFDRGYEAPPIQRVADDTSGEEAYDELNKRKAT